MMVYSIITISFEFFIVFQLKIK